MEKQCVNRKLAWNIIIVQHADTFKTSKSFLKYLSLLHAFIFVTLMLLMCSDETLVWKLYIFSNLFCYWVE